MPPLTMYYPIRGNAYGLATGAQYAAFKRRLKVSALMHDRLILDSDYWLAASGPRGNFEMRIPRDKVPSGQQRLQSPRTRKRAEGAQFHLDMAASDGGQARRIIESPASISWQATFEPIRSELPHAYPWIEFESFELSPPYKKRADDLADQLQDDALLAARFEDGFTRLLIAKSVSHAGVLASLMGAAVSYDGLHREVMASQVARGLATPVFGHSALVAVLPDVRSLTWERVDAARDLPGLARLRYALEGIEIAAREAARSEAELDDAMLREFIAEYARAVREAHDGWGSVWMSIAVGTAVSLAVARLDPATGIVAGSVVSSILEASRKLVGEHRARNTWVVAADELRAMSQLDRPSPAADISPPADSPFTPPGRAGGAR